MWAAEAPVPAPPLAPPLAPRFTELFADFSARSLDRRLSDPLGPSSVTPQIWRRTTPIRRLNEVTAAFTADTEIDDGLRLAKIEHSPTTGCHSGVALLTHLIQKGQAA